MNIALSRRFYFIQLILSSLFLKINCTRSVRSDIEHVRIHLGDAERLIIPPTKYRSTIKILHPIPVIRNNDKFYPSEEVEVSKINSHHQNAKKTTSSDLEFLKEQQDGDFSVDIDDHVHLADSLAGKLRPKQAVLLEALSDEVKKCCGNEWVPGYSKIGVNTAGWLLAGDKHHHKYFKKSKEVVLLPQLYHHHQPVPLLPIRIAQSHDLGYRNGKNHHYDDIKPVTEHIEGDLKYDFRTKTHSI